MKLKHRIQISVSDHSESEETILCAADRWLPRWLTKWLFGNYQQIYLITPGKSITGIDIQETEGTTYEA